MERSIALVVNKDKLPPLGTPTTEQTTARDLTATLDIEGLAAILEQRQIEVGRMAHWRARMVVALSDPASVDAAVWRAADQLWGELNQPHGDTGPLRHQSLAIRVFYFTVAARTVHAYRSSLEGLDGVTRTAQAFSDFNNHRNQLAMRSTPPAGVQ